MDWLKTCWGWLSNSKNQKTLAFIGGGFAVIIGAGWQAYTHWSKPESPNPTPPNITATRGGIAAGRDVLIKGGVTFQGISEERFQRLSGELGVTNAALSSFFKILKQKHIPLEDLDNTLREIARRYKTLQEKLTSFSSDDPAVAALKRQASESLDAGDFDRAEALLNEASEKDVEAARRMQEIAHKRFLSAAASKAENGDLKYTQLAFAEAAAYYRQAAELVPAGGELALADYLTLQGLMAIDAGDYTGAKPPLERSLAIRERALEPKHPDVAQSLNNLAELYRVQGKYAEAEPLYKRSLAIWEKALGPQHPNVASSLENYTALLWKTNRNGEAAKMEARAKAIRAKHAR